MIVKDLIKEFGASTIRVEKRNVPEWKQARERVQENSKRALYAAERHCQLPPKW